MQDIRERLRGLRRPPLAPGLHSDAGRASRCLPQPAASGDGRDLERLEAHLLGARGDEGLSLKARLERLVAAADRARQRREVVRFASPIEDLVRGRRVQNDHGSFFLVEDSRHLDSRHGELPLSRLRAVLPGSVAVVAGEPEMHSFDLARAAFLDTETTGLAGGTGTAAFLVGVGFVAEERFVVQQYLMRDYDEEAAQLRGLSELLASFPYLVTYNGKAFDVPLLEARYRLDRQAFPAAGAQHLDLLPPARRLWKLRLESCRLQSLEAALLGVRRTGDVPGEEIPRIYFDYVRSRDASGIARVLEHNRMDVLSLAALSALACQWVNGEGPDDARDAYSLGRVFERARLYERSDAQYRRAVREDAGALRAAALLRLAAHAKRGGDLAAACDLWDEAARSGSWYALRELAVHHEHRSGDLAAALSAADRGLVLAADGDGGSPRAVRDFVRRKDRLARRAARRVSPDP